MNVIKLLTVIAIASFAALASRADSPFGPDTVTVQGTILLQTNNTETSTTTKFHDLKIKVTTKDILQLVAKEFNATSGITNSGSKLAVDNFYGGEFEVLDKSNNVILVDASVNLATNDDYALNLYNFNEVYTGSESDSHYMTTATVVTQLNYTNAVGTAYFSVNGLANVKQQTTEHEAAVAHIVDDETGSQSFKFSGSGNGTVSDTQAIVTGTVSGSGKLRVF